MKQLEWNKVGALTEDGEKYTNYMSDMQVSKYICRVATL